MYPNEYIGVNDGLPGSRASFLLSGLCNFGSFSFLKSFSEEVNFHETSYRLVGLRGEGIFLDFRVLLK